MAFLDLATCGVKSSKASCKSVKMGGVRVAVFLLDDDLVLDLVDDLSVVDLESLEEDASDFLSFLLLVLL